ncbi:MAG: protease complex subunit PrcB family protein [Anaerovoracaceae bacterium]
MNLKENLKKKRLLAAVGAMIVIGVITAAVCLNMLGDSKPVEFEEIKESQLPKEITADVIPEYKTLERALACIIDDDVYVIVTRGEKPTSGFKVSVDNMVLEEKDGKSTLVVYANFQDPDKKTAFSQIITYPIQVVKTNLNALPDNIELRIQY